MCRSDVQPAAAETLARLMVEIAEVLAVREGADPSAVRIGPVDFGPEHREVVATSA